MWSPPDIRTLGQRPEVHSVVFLTVDYSVHSAVDMQQHTIVAAPLRQGGIGCETTCE